MMFIHSEIQQKLQQFANIYTQKLLQPGNVNAKRIARNRGEAERKRE